MKRSPRRCSPSEVFRFIQTELNTYALAASAGEGVAGSHQFSSQNPNGLVPKSRHSGKVRLRSYRLLRIAGKSQFDRIA